MDELCNLNEFLEQKVKDDIMKETTYLDIQKYLKNISNCISSLKAQVEILDNDTKLNLIELLLEEASADLEDYDHTCTYVELARNQLKKLRDPC